MAYDDTARKLAVKVIGTVESGLDYTAVNYNDPITVGIAQWYGTRAANVLCRMRDENTAAWTGIDDTINFRLAAVDKNDSSWNSYYLTQAQGESLKGAMSRNEAIQNAQLGDDLEPYKQTAIEYGFNPDTNTKTVIYFFCMHHQSPQSALQVVLTLDTEATLEQIHAATLNHSVLGLYSNRYNEAYEMIKSGNVDESPGTGEPSEPAPEPADIPKVAHMTTAGDVAILRYTDGQQQQLLPNGHNYWFPANDIKQPVAVAPEEPPVSPTDPPVTPPPSTGGWNHPLPGSVITSPYGPRSLDDFHYGTDFSTGVNANIIAPTDLIITIAFEDGAGGSWSAGTYAKGHTPDGRYTMNFYHMVAGSLNVSVGQTIPKGHVIGREGATGNAFGAHLHFEMYDGVQNDAWPPPYGNPINPEPILRANGVSI